MVTDTPVEVSDEVAMAILAEPLCTNSIIDLLTWKMVGFDFGMSTEVSMTAVIASSGALEVLVPTLDAGIWAATMAALESLPTLVSS